MTRVSDETRARLRLLVAGQGDSRLVSQAIAKFGSAEKAIESPALRSRLRLGLTKDTELKVERELSAVRMLGARVLDGEDGPLRLDKQQPVVLSVSGAWPTGRSVAIVGSRDADSYGVSVAQTIARALAQVGVAVISGGAHGIDAAAQTAALDARGETLAFLGFGIAHRAATVPEKLLDRLFAEGTVVSEFLPTARGSKTSYLERNRLIAALADAVIVVQARLKSGSLNTARHAKRFGTPVFAVPGDVGSPLSRGTNKLIASGNAALLHDIGALGRSLQCPDLRQIDWPNYNRPAAEAEALRSDVCVSAHPSRLDQALTAIEKAGGSLDRVSLAGALRLDMPVLDEFLLEMELEGHLSKNPSGRYVDSRRGNGAKY